MTDENGQAPRVKFGPRPNQHLDLDTAERVLSAMFNRFPLQAGEELARVLIGDQAVRAKRVRERS